MIKKIAIVMVEHCLGVNKIHFSLRVYVSSYVRHVQEIQSK